jgi:putative ABC transport system permease protein
VKLLDDFAQDARYAIRSFARNRAFTAVAVLTLALGIGANTAIFTVVRAVLLKSLPYTDADRLVRVMENVPASDMPDGRARRIAALPASDVGELQRRTRTLAAIASYTQAGVTLTGREAAVYLSGALVSPILFHLLDVQPIIGRIFDVPAGGAIEPVVVLGYGAWQRQFGGDPAVIGRTLTLDAIVGPGFPPDGKAYTIVGVMPPAFQFPTAETQVWIPYEFPKRFRLPALARLARDASVEAATIDTAAILREVRGLKQPDRAEGQPRFELVRARDILVAPVKPALVALTAAVGFVLLIACANVASLMLAKTTARRREFAIRASLGAGTGRVARQLLTESVTLALAGGVAGTALAVVGVQLLRTLATTLSRIDIGPGGTNFPRFGEIELDPAVLAFTAAVSIATGIVFGLAPAIRQSRRIHMDVLRDGTTSAAGAPFKSRGLLVVAEIALAMVLLGGGGMMIHSFVNLSSVNPGFNADRVLTFQIPLPNQQYPLPALKTFAEDLVAALRRLPSVESAAYAHQLPMVKLRQIAGFRRTPALPNPPGPMAPEARFVSRDYFTVLGIRIVSGRGFRDEDGPGKPGALVINQTLARREFAGENPIGQTVYLGSDTNGPGVGPALGRPLSTWQVVGIVEDVRQYDLDQEPSAQFFVDFRQWPGANPVFDVPQYFAVRTSGDPALVVSEVRSVVRQLEPRAVVYNLATMKQLVAATISRPRMYAVLLGIFAAAALALATIGIYGLLAYSVSQRSREIGIRMALGAGRRDVMALVLVQSAVLVGAGLAAGLGGAVAATRYLEGLLFGVTPMDPATFGAISAIVAGAAIAASYVPARRATKVDPLVALRCE